MAFKLTEGEIKKRLIRLRNLETLHAQARKQNDTLRKRNKDLKARVSALEATVVEQQTIITTLKLQLEELQRIVFGKKKKKSAEGNDEDNQPPHKAAERATDSYHRRIPADEEVTSTEHHSIAMCPDCGTPLGKLETRVSYEEDIVLPDTTTTPLKTVAKHEVERGWCTSCHAWRTPVPIHPVTVVLGTHVKLYICYLSILIRLSFEQIATHLKITYDFDISDGEIAYILQKEARALRSEYEALKERIRVQRGVHYDETSWKVQKEERGNYAWTMTGTETNEVAFLCGESRGGGVVDLLRGDDADHVGITDDYVGYHKKFKKHQLCWAHPHRKLRDLKDSEKLDSATREHCRAVFEAFSALYQKVDAVRRTPFVLEERLQKKAALTVSFDEIATEHPSDPHKLKKIKQRLREKKELYFTCIMNEGIPPDNNKAERSLRHLVIKRKISFGSKTQRGAETLSILVSILLSLWWRKPRNFFQELAAMRGL